MIPKYTIVGGNKLKGEIILAGAKNVSTKVIIASLLADSKSVFENMPRISDVETTLFICKSLGVKYKWLDKNVLEVDPSHIKSYKIPVEYSGLNRMPILFFGPLLYRFGKAEVPTIGGCSIGARPVDLHESAYKDLGAEIEYSNHYYRIKSPKGLKGTIIKLNYPSVGATENILLGSVLAKGTTVIQNAAIEPEVEELALFLQSMGAMIYQDVNRTWIIKGVQQLHGANYKIMFDRNEFVSFACLAMANRGDILIKGVEQRYVMTFLNAARKIGANFTIYNDAIRFHNNENVKFKSIAVETDVHPGFMTDWQQPFCVVLTQANGTSIIHETVYENRLGYTDALNKMGANIQLFPECLGSKPCRFVNKDYLHSALITGPTALSGAKIEVPDLRAGFSYVIAAVIAKGKSELIGVEKIQRGYEDLKDRLQNIGAIIDETK